MAIISVDVNDVTVQLYDNVKIKDFLDELVDALQMPRMSNDGKAIPYVLSRRDGVVLDSALTLKKAGVGYYGKLKLISADLTIKTPEPPKSEPLPEPVPVPAPAPTPTPTPAPAPVVPQFVPQQPQYMPAANFNKRVAKLVSAGVGALGGVVSLIGGFVVMSSASGSYAHSETYGGDAYTGIQNASVTTANNINRLIDVARDGFAFLLIAFGIAAIGYFGLKFFQNLERK